MKEPFAHAEAPGGTARSREAGAPTPGWCDGAQDQLATAVEHLHLELNGQKKAASSNAGSEKASNLTILPVR